MILLQPFDTKTPTTVTEILKLFGYGVVTAVSYLICHLLELYWYRKQKQVWVLANEVSMLVVFFLLATTFANLYHSIFFMFESKSIFAFMMFYVRFALPFSIVFAPLLLFLRQRKNKTDNTSMIDEDIPVIEINGSNQNEALQFPLSDFYYAVAQQNYVLFALMHKERDIRESMIRTTLKEVAQQFPQAVQVHRSYLVNPMHIEKLHGTKRKQTLRMKGLETVIPVSETFQDRLNQGMQTRPKNC